MKKYIVISLLFALLIVGLLSMRQTNDAKPVLQTDAKAELDITDAANRFVLVELFTSEGCSSCPSADNLVNATVAEEKPNVYVLCYHVDYWNRLGWKDEYSSAAFSERQKAYANALGLEGVYTPQIVVNGHTEFVGSNAVKLSNALVPKNQAENLTDLALHVSGQNEKIIVVVQTKKNADATLRIALVQKHAETQVKKGENEGLTLKHVNVVRELKSFAVDQAETMTSFDLPSGLQNSDVEVIAFLQDNKTMQIVSVAKKQMQ